MQAVKPMVQEVTQRPDSQVSPDAQEVPQAPQWRGSRCRSAQAREPSEAMQVLRPWAQLAAQLPAEHTSPGPHRRPQAPQWSRSVAVSTQISAPTVPPSLAPAEQATWPVGHESRQVPLSHCRPPVQAFPHAPQLALSAFTATQRSPQSICDPVQLGRVSVGASKPASESEASWDPPTTGVPSHAATKSVVAIASHDKQDRPVGTLIIWNLPTVNRPDRAVKTTAAGARV